MISRKKFQVVYGQKVSIELSDLTLFELFQDVIEEVSQGTIHFLKIDSLLYLLHFAEFEEGVRDRISIQMAECIMREGAYQTEFGVNLLKELLILLRSRLRSDYFVRGTIILTEDDLLVNEKLYILPLLD